MGVGWIVSRGPVSFCQPLSVYSKNWQQAAANRITPVNFRELAAWDVLNRSGARGLNLNICGSDCDNPK